MVSVTPSAGRSYGITDTVKTKLAGSDTDGTQGYMLTALLTIKRIIHMLMQQLAFNRKPIVFPLLLKMNESPLPGTEPEVLYPRQHQHIVFRIHTRLLYQLFNRDICRHSLPVDRNGVVAERAGKLHLFFFIDFYKIK